MLTGLNNALLEWFRNTTDRQKLQHAYIIIVILSVLVAGVVGLVDNSLGQDILVVTVAAGAIFLVNSLLWALFESTLLSRLSGRHKR